MTTEIECPQCGDNVEVTDPEVGKEVTCTGCDDELVVIKSGDLFFLEAALTEEDEEEEDDEDEEDDDEDDDV